MSGVHICQELRREIRDYCEYHGVHIDGMRIVYQEGGDLILVEGTETESGKRVALLLQYFGQKGRAIMPGQNEFDVSELDYTYDDEAGLLRRYDCKEERA